MHAAPARWSASQADFPIDQNIRRQDVCWHCDMAGQLEDRAAVTDDEIEADALLVMAMEQYERCDCD